MDIMDNLISAMDALIVHLPSLENPRVRSIKNKVDKLPYLARRALIGSKNIVAHGLTEAPLLVVIAVGLQQIIDCIESRLHLVLCIVIGLIRRIGLHLFVQEIATSRENGHARQGDET